MNRMILIAVLIILSQAGSLFAQNDDMSIREKRWRMSKTEKTFNMIPSDARIRDYVYLRNGTMILELTNVDDFKKLNNLDSILMRFRKDIAFYTDSLEKFTGNVRIDYAIVEGHDFTQLRFKKHDPDGEFYVNKDDQVSKLKLEQDTVRIIMHVRGKEVYSKGNLTGMSKVAVRPQYAIQVTFCMNNYKDIDKMIADKSMLQHAIDTLLSTKRRRTIEKPAINPSSSLYRPYSAYSHFEQFNGIIKNDYFTPGNIMNRRDKILLNLGMGAGLVRNTLAPMAEMALSYVTQKGYTGGDYFTLVEVSATPYFFFDRNPDGQFFVKDNWFINAAVGSPADIFGLKTQLFTAGVGYLMVQKGDYFKGTTMKAFLTVKLKSSITVCPELIFTDNFKQIFPGITVKIL